MFADVRANFPDQSFGSPRPLDGTGASEAPTAHLGGPTRPPADPGLAGITARNGTDRVLRIGFPRIDFLPEKRPEEPAALRETPSWENVLAEKGGHSAAYAQGAISAVSGRSPCQIGIDAACILLISNPIRTNSARGSANASSCQS